MSTLLKMLSIDVTEVRNCPECGAHAVGVRGERRYLHETAELQVTLPIWTCEACGYAYTDGRGEKIEQAAIADYIKAHRQRKLAERDIELILDVLGLKRGLERIRIKAQLLAQLEERHKKLN